MKKNISRTGFFHIPLDKDISQEASSPHFSPFWWSSQPEKCTSIERSWFAAGILFPLRSPSWIAKTVGCIHPHCMPASSAERSVHWPKWLEQQVSNRQVILGFLDVILTVPAFFIEFNHFFWRLFRAGDKTCIQVCDKLGGLTAWFACNKGNRWVGHLHNKCRIPFPLMTYLQPSDSIVSRIASSK